MMEAPRAGAAIAAATRGGKGDIGGSRSGMGIRR
jgi:hypothetical protein